MESANDPKKFSILGNYDNKIFWPVAILYGCIIAYAIIDPSGAGATFSSIQRFIIAHFSWLILLTGASAIFFSVWMACSSRFATVLCMGRHAVLRSPRHRFRHLRGCRAALSPVHRPHGHGCRERWGRSGRPRGHPALRSELGPIRLAAVRRRWMGYRVCGLSP